ncbi:MAG: protein kinase [Vicinamibacteria bacterium]|nr:protein kinase [Vicinamibacteria bacterium]
MTKGAGTRLGPYEIVAPLGAGGMGEVLRARDPKLGREVAIKVLPAAFAQDAERVARFRREAQILAALNHANIAAIYGLEESEGVLALVMELVEGEDLAQRLKRGAIPVDESVAIAKQIAEALEEAHERGIVHRDLKPANVKVTVEGKVKVLDFGLAKAFAADPMAASGSHDLSQSPTLAGAGTMAGVILGTAAYMSPEQARGKSVDRRADIWAFGVVLFEMLTGKRLFGGETVSDTLAAVLRQEIDWKALPAATPASLRRLLERCLDRDPQQRLRDIGEARVALATPEATAAALSREARARRPATWALAAGVVALVVTGWATGRFFSTAPSARAGPLWVSIVPPATVQGRATDPAISPDGRSVAFVAPDAAGVYQLWLRDLATPRPRAIPGTEDPLQPFWSPDGKWLGFFAGGKLKKVLVAGGSPEVLADAPRARGGTWNAKGEILFTPNSFVPIHRTTAAGGSARPIADVDPLALLNERHAYPHFLPDGRHFVFSRGTSIAVGSLDSPEVKDIAAVPSRAQYAIGHLFYVRDGDLYAQPFDLERLGLGAEETRSRRSPHGTGDGPGPAAEPDGPLHGEPVKVADAIGWTFETPTGFDFDVSRSGAIAYWDRAGRPTTQLTWLDRTGRALGTLGEPAAYLGMALSPDGRNVAVEMHEPRGGRVSVWMIDAATGARSRFATLGLWTGLPLWSADGTHVLVTNFTENLHVLPLGGGPARQIPVGPGGKFPSSWSRDERFVVYSEAGEGVRDLGVLEVAGGAPTPLVRTPFLEIEGRLSPDGAWLALQSDESGRDEVYVQAFPGGEQKLRISTNGGRYPVWSRDGRALFHISGSGDLVESELAAVAGRSLQTRTSRVLFRAPQTAGGSDRHRYAVSADGQRFLFNVVVPETGPQAITLLLGWSPETTR